MAEPRAGRAPLDGATLVVVDDDPTGSQVVAGVPLLLRFDDADVVWALDQGSDVVFALTNSRALPEGEAVALTRKVTRRLAAAVLARGGDVRVVSRSDSTLRGHFPAEVRAMDAGLRDAGLPGGDVVVLCPAYPEAGRVTVGGVHHVRRGDALVPVAETEFAADPVFAYGESDLRAWAASRCGVARDAVRLVSLRDLREGGSERVAEVLLAVERGAVVVVDAEVRADLDVAAAGVAAAERAGRRVLCRTGPSFVAAAAGRPVPRPLEDVGLAREHGVANGGVVVVGSHTDLTTRQLAHAVDAHRLAIVELDVAALTDPARRAGEVARAAADVARRLRRDSVALVTGRDVVRGRDADDSAGLKATIAGGVSEVVARTVATVAPRFVVAKGGITSHDVAARALGAGRATVLGQLFAGRVSVWRLADGLRPGMPYVVFPGNVGDEQALADALSRLEVDRSTNRGRVLAMVFRTGQDRRR